MNTDVAKAIGWTLCNTVDCPDRGEHWQQLPAFDDAGCAICGYTVDDLLTWLDENAPAGRHSYWLRRSWIPEGIGWEVDIEMAPDNADNRAFIEMSLLAALEQAVLAISN